MKKSLLSSAFALLLANGINAQGCVIANYPLNGNGTDISGNGYNGTPSGSPTAVTDRFGNANSAVYFSGSDMYSTTCPGVSGNGNRTISFWANVGAGNAGGYVLDYGGGGFGGSFHVELSTLGVYIDISDGAVTYSSNPKDGVWHNYVITYSSVFPSMDGISVYRDGTCLTVQATNYNALGHSVNTATATQLVIGGSSDMMLDDFKMMACAYTQAQIDSMFKADMVPNGCLLARYDFNNNLTDYSANGNNAVPYSISSTADRFGNLNSAYSFDSNVSAHIGCGSGINIANHDYSISIWAQRGYTSPNNYTLLGQGNSTVDNGLHIAFTGGTAPQKLSFDQFGDSIYDTTNTSSQAWTHWFFSANNTTHAAKIYRNGQLYKSGVFTGSYGGSGNLEIGAWLGSNTFDGNLDDVKIFGCELSATQVDSIFQLEKVPCTLTTNTNAHGDIMCYGSNNGFLDVTGQGGTAPYTYSWSPGGATTNNITNLIPGSYTVTVTDAAGCIATDVEVITESAQIIVTPSVQSPSCAGYCDGVVIANGTGGSGGLYYSFSPINGIGNMMPNACAGNVTIAVVDDAGCSIPTLTVTVLDPPVLSVAATLVNDVSCFGGHDGYLTAAATGGSAPYTFTWSDTLMTNTLSNSQNFFYYPAGTYSVMVQDANSCYAGDTGVIHQPTQIVPTIMVTPASCNTADGAASISGTGGVLPYTYQWSNGSNASSISNLFPGSYSGDIIDAHGCVATRIAAVGTSSGPTINIVSVNNISCHNARDGSISTTVSGGVPPFIINWSDMDSGYVVLSRTNLQPGPYDLSVTDANGCAAITTINITEPAPLSAAFSYIPSGCASANGSIAATVNGGTAPYTYQWSANAGSATTANVSPLAAGMYKFVFTDANSCKDSTTAFLNDSTVIMATGIATASDCGTSMGAIDITPFTGTGPYSFFWSTGDATEDVASLAPGDYGVLITDANNCHGALQFEVPSATANYTPQLCLVTVDTSDERNIIMWEAPNVGGITEFRIYRETSTPGIYRQVGTTPLNGITDFKDTIASAELHGWKYRVSAFDSCGSETGMSEIEHRPVHLVVTPSVNADSAYLSWSDYMGTSNFTTYYIWRNHYTTGWILIDSVPRAQSSYVDINLPMGGDTVDYFIEIKTTFSCNSSRTIINTSRSNIKHQMVNASLAVNENELESAVNIYPNPVKDAMQVAVKAVKEGQMLISVYNLQGQEVFKASKNVSVGMSTETIPAKNLADGLYIVKINFNGKTIHRKIMKQ